MIQINLVGKRKRTAKGRSWFMLGLAAVFVLFSLYFVGSSIYVVIKLSMVNSEAARVNRETEEVSKQIASNSENLSNFVLSKYILGKVVEVNQQKFPYREYLNQVIALMPQDAILKNVDFSIRGWVAVAAEVSTMAGFDELENSLTSEAKLGETPFAAIFAEGINKNQDGFYDAKLQLQLKANGGK